MDDKIIEVKKRGRPYGKKKETGGVTNSFEFRYIGNRVYNFQVDYDLSETIHISAIRIFFNKKDYPLERAIGNIGKGKFKNLIEKMLKKKRIIFSEVSYSPELAQILGLE